MRITLDWDDEKMTKPYSVLFNELDSFFPLNEKEIFRTKNGFHVIIHDVNCDEKMTFHFRRVLGDDPLRLKLDIEKYKNKSKRARGVLWTKKNGVKEKKITVEQFKKMTG